MKTFFHHHRNQGKIWFPSCGDTYSGTASVGEFFPPTSLSTKLCTFPWGKISDSTMFISRNYNEEWETGRKSGDNAFLQSSQKKPKGIKLGGLCLATQEQKGENDFWKMITFQMKMKWKMISGSQWFCYLRILYICNCIIRKYAIGIFLFYVFKVTLIAFLLKFFLISHSLLLWLC